MTESLDSEKCCVFAWVC